MNALWLHLRSPNCSSQGSRQDQCMTKNGAAFQSIGSSFLTPSTQYRPWAAFTPSLYGSSPTYTSSEGTRAEDSNIHHCFGSGWILEIQSCRYQRGDQLVVSERGSIKARSFPGQRQNPSCPELTSVKGDGPDYKLPPTLQNTCDLCLKTFKWKPRFRKHKRQSLSNSPACHSS